MLGDFNIAEQDFDRFAGPRVIRENNWKKIYQKVPKF